MKVGDLVLLTCDDGTRQEVVGVYLESFVDEDRVEKHRSRSLVDYLAGREDVWESRWCRPAAQTEEQCT